MDLVASENTDIAGDIRDLRALGIAPSFFDVIIDFAVIEHVPCLGLLRHPPPRRFTDAHVSAPQHGLALSNT
jgi:hypothetical protein